MVALFINLGRCGALDNSWLRSIVICKRILPSVAPSRSFSGRGSGSWGSAAFALGRGRRVLLWLPGGVRPPAWSSVSWSSAGALGSAGCWWLGVAVPVPAQLSLF